MTDARPEPPVPADVDLRGYSSFMLDVDRLLASELVALATPEEAWAALLLWCRAWKQSPPGSLPNDDRVLASFSGAGAKWRKVRAMALRGFVECSDGRLYHRVLCEQVDAAWKRRQEHDKKRDRDAERLRQWRERNGRETRSETPLETPSETQRETRFNAATSPREQTGQDRTGQDITSKAVSSECPTSPALALPGTLSPPTWAAWRAHLANLGKPLTPQAERLQLARLAEHADPDATVRKAIERGHRNLEPVGGYADAKPRQTVHDKRAATAAAIYGKPPEPPNVEPTDITGEARRIA